MEGAQLPTDVARVSDAASATQSKLLKRIQTLEKEVTDLRQAEAKLQNSEARWRAVVCNLPDIMMIVDRHLKFQYINRTIPELDAQAIIGTNILDYVLPPHHELLQECHNRVFETGEVAEFETEGLGANETVAWYASRLVPLKVKGQVESVVYVVTDITERKQAEKLAHANERRFRTLVENAPLCIFEVDITRAPPQILIANRRAELVYGWPPGQFSTLPFSKIFAPHDLDTAETVISHVRLGRPVKLESEHARRDGMTFPVRIRATPEMVDDHHQRMIVTVEDIATEKLRRSELGALDEERRRIAHEIHDGLAQNLAALRLKAALWHDLLTSNPEKMHGEVEHLLAALKSYIGDVRRSIFALRPIALDELSFFPALRQFLALFNQYYAVQTQLKILGPEKHLPSALELPLFRVVQEALNNVGQHAKATTAWIEIDLLNPDAVVLTVRDNGIGFAQMHSEQVDGAEHLGLKHMRERVEGFGGTFFIQSAWKVGTEIRVLFPFRQRAPFPAG